MRADYIRFAIAETRREYIRANHLPEIANTDLKKKKTHNVKSIRSPRRRSESKTRGYQTNYYVRPLKIMYLRVCEYGKI